MSGQDFDFQPMENPTVTRFREYLRFPSVHPNPDYSGCIAWLKGQAKEIGLKFNILHFPKPNEFALWLTWDGTNSELPSILLNSHIDVVPVDAAKWKRDPFGAEKDSDGNIYARGAQDMKCVGVQYLEAIRKLKSKGFQPRRTVHVSFVPDEEVGGEKGMGCFSKTREFANLNIGFGLDEGIASADDTYNLYYGERTLWQIRFTALGATGHASLLPENTAAQKIQTIINKMLAIRTEQKILLNSSPGMELGDVTSVNMTMLQGGLQANIVPPELHVVFDIRITPNWDLSDFRKRLDGICKEAGQGVSYASIRSYFSEFTPPTPLTQDNIWWTTFKATADKLRLELNAKIFPARTDVMYLRQIGIPAFGFSPMNKTPILLHDHDEYLNENVFIRGIEIYEALLESITNIP